MGKIYFNIDALADELCVEASYAMMPTDSVATKRYIWKHDELPAAADAARKAAEAGGELCFTGGAMPWLLGGVVAYLAPVLSSFGMDGGEREVFVLPMGEPSEAGQVKFDVEERDGKTYISCRRDDPDKPAEEGSPHNYDLDRLKGVVLPGLKPGTQLYLKPQSYFYILSVFLKSWVGLYDSISIWGDFSDSYIRSFSKDSSDLGLKVI